MSRLCSRVSLEDFPDEILGNIISRTYRSKDIGSLLLVSPHLNQLVKVSPSFDNSKSYNSVDFGEEWCPEKGPARYRSLLHSTLTSVLRNPQLALYVEKIILDWGYRHEPETNFEVADDEKTQLLDLIFRWTGILEWEAGKRFVLALKEGKQHAYVALLLLVLGNLEILSMTIDTENEWVTWAIKEAASCDFIPLSLSSGLRKLRRVEVSWSGYNAWYLQGGISLYSIAPLFSLPCIEYIEADEVIHLGLFEWYGQYGSSTVKTLSFNHSYINIAALETILRIPDALENFKYCYITGLTADDIASDVAALIKLKGIQNSSLEPSDVPVLGHTIF